MVVLPPQHGGAYGGGAKLFVGCLPYSKTEADLEPLFSQYGPVLECVVLRGPTGSSKGAGFVTFQDEVSASSAMSCLQSYVFEGSTRGINISFATSSGGSKPAAAARPVQLQPPPPQHAALPALGGIPASPPGSKLFVGQLPYSRTETDLIQLFGSIGPVVEVCLLKDKRTQEKTGAAFVRYQTPQHAAAAAATLDGFLFSGSTRPITVSMAQSGAGESPAPIAASLGQKRPLPAMNAVALRSPPVSSPMAPLAIHSEPGAKLFVGQLPFSRSEEDLKQIFGAYGPVLEVVLHRDAQGQKKGGAFVRFASAVEAASAMALDGFMFQGSTRPITVSIAEEGASKRRRME